MSVCQCLIDYGVVGLAGEIGGLERVIGRGCLPTANYSTDLSFPLPVRVRSPGAGRSFAWGCRGRLELYFWGLFLRRFAFFCLPTVCLPFLVAAGLWMFMLFPSVPLAVAAAVGVGNPICGVLCG